MTSRESDPTIARVNGERNVAKFSRRTLLRTGLLGTLVVVVGGGAVASRKTKLRRAPRGGLRVLTLAEYSILAAIADRVCPEPRPGVPGATALDIAGLADRLFEKAGDDAKKGVKTALAVFENGLTGAMFFERVTPFTQLSAAEQDEVLTAFRDSRVGIRRTIYRALSSLAASMYYGHPDVWDGIGYPGPADIVALRGAYPEQLVDYTLLRYQHPGAR